MIRLPLINVEKTPKSVFLELKNNLVLLGKNHDVPGENQSVVVRESETISQCQLSFTHVNNGNSTENHIKLDRTMY